MSKKAFDKTNKSELKNTRSTSLIRFFIIDI